MQVIGNNRIMVISKFEEYIDGGIAFSRLIIGSVRGDYARTRTAPKPTGLPDAHDEHGEDHHGVQIL